MTATDRALLEQRRRVEVARARFAPAGPGSSDAAPPDVVVDVTDDVAGSWQRCAALPPTVTAPDDPDADASERWQASPIRLAAAEVVDELGRVAEAGDLVAAVTDDRGQIVWSHGGRTMARRAARANFVTGARWDERSAGTNAPGLALVTGRPETVFSAEHWSEEVHDWVCYAAPVHAPGGAVVGVLDLSTTWDHASPLALSTVTTMARLTEQLLAAASFRPGQADGSGVSGVPGLSGAVAGPAAPPIELRVLGHAHVTVGGAPVNLPRRQLEILTALVLRGEATLDELQWSLYGDRPIGASTLKAEISHLRRVLGGCIASRPYRLTAAVDADVVRVLDAIRAGHADDAAADYAGQLLPLSEAPLVVETRHHLDVALRTALLQHGSARNLLRFAESHPFDREVLEQAEARAGADDPLRPDVVARLAVVDADLT